MSITNDFFVYYQGEEDYFLKIKATYTKYSNLYQLFGSFLNEFSTSFNLKNKNSTNTQFFYIDTITDQKILITNFSINIPESKYEYLIRSKDITDDSYPNTIADSNLIDSMIQKGEQFESIGRSYTAYSFYTVAGKRGIPNLIKMFYNLKDFESITKYLNDTTQFEKDPYLNEILGYTYEWLNNKQKAMEIFSIFNDKAPIQTLAYNRLLYTSGPTKSRNQPKLSIEKEILSCMKPSEITFDVQSLTNNSFFCIPPRSQKIYVQEVIKTFIARSLYKEAIDFLVTNTRFFNVYLPLFTANNNLASYLVSSISNPTLSISIARKVCYCLLDECQFDLALRLCTFAYNLKKTDLQSISLLMHVYYSMLKYDKIAILTAEIMEIFKHHTTLYNENINQFFDKISYLPDFNKNICLEEKPIQTKQYLFDSIEHQKKNFDDKPLSGYDRLYFMIYIMIYLLSKHHLKEVSEILTIICKSMKNEMSIHDEIFDIFHLISIVQTNIITYMYFAPENKKFYIIGDVSVFIFINVVFKLTDKAIKGEVDEISEKNQKTSTKNYNDFHNFWSYQAMMNQEENGILVQSESLLVPQFSLWRIREEKQKKKYAIFAFESRLKQLKEHFAKSKIDDEVVVLSFGKVDILKHIPKLILKRKFSSFEELKEKYSSLYVSMMKRVRNYLPKNKILIHLDYFECSDSNASSLFYEAICQNVLDNVEIILPIKKFRELFSSKNNTYTAEKDIDYSTTYIYQYYIEKSKKSLNS